MPSEKADKTPMVNGTVRAIEQVGTNIWLGGKFTQVKRHKVTVVANVSNLAVFNSKTKQYMNIAPKLGGTDSEVWDMTLYGENVLAATHCALAAARTKDAGEWRRLYSCGRWKQGRHLLWPWL